MKKGFIRIPKERLKRLIVRGMIVFILASGGYMLGGRIAEKADSFAKRKLKEIKETRDRVVEADSIFNQNSEELGKLSEAITDSVIKLAKAKSDTVMLKSDSPLFKGEIGIAFRDSTLELVGGLSKSDALESLYNKLGPKERRFLDSTQVEVERKLEALAKSSTESEVIKLKIKRLENDLRRRRNWYGIGLASLLAAAPDIYRWRKRRKNQNFKFRVYETRRRLLRRR